MNEPVLKSRLNELRTGFQQLPTVDEPPSTTLQILGERTSEAHWESLLAYFINPSEPHGFETDILEAFLSHLDEEPDVGFSLDRRDLSKVEVETQVGTENGIPDVLLWVDEDWFLCLELKVRASETANQTIRYVNSSWIGDLDKDRYDSANEYYAYLAAPNADSPASDAFVHLSWIEVANDLQEVLIEDRGQYPSKSYAQLSDFIDTINEEFTMTEYRENIDEKARLRIEFGEEIEEIDRALDAAVETAQTNWISDFSAVEPPIWDDAWHHNHLGNKYAQLYRREWLSDMDQDGDQTPKNAEAGVTFQFIIDRDVFLEEEIEVILKTTGGSPREDTLEDYLYSSSVRPQLEEASKAAGATVRDQNDRKQILYKQVPFRLSDGDTVGGRAAEALNELSEVADVVTNTVGDVLNDSDK